MSNEKNVTNSYFDIDFLSFTYPSKLLTFNSHDVTRIYAVNNINSSIMYSPGGGAVGYSVRLACGMLGVRVPAKTDLNR